MEVETHINYLDKLKIKPKPKKSDDQKIIINVEHVKKDDESDEEKETAIQYQDKTKENRVNRDDIIEKMRNRMAKKTESKKSESEPKKLEPVNRLKIIMKEESEPKSASESESELEEIIAPKKQPKKREPINGEQKKKPTIFHIEDTVIEHPKNMPTSLPISPYYLNNRKLFIGKLEKMFKEFTKDIVQDGDNELLFHQRLAREYLNTYSPYRGLLLYYGLGTGKSATAVSIAEGLKSNKKIFLMIPASLETNFMNEIKKFGDHMYRKNQHWTFVSTKGQPEKVEKLLSEDALPLTKQYIDKHGGAWTMDRTKSPNYDSLTNDQQADIDDQIDAMIRTKYTQINYNAGNLKSKIDLFSKNDTVNPFDNSVVIVDEAHKLVSLIVNKLNKLNKVKKQPETDPTSIRLYKLLMNATNAKIVLLTGTPIVNYPNEIAVLFNILRGYIKTWTFELKNSAKHTTAFLLDLFAKNGITTYDYVNVKGDTLQITRNPFGFVNVLAPEKLGGGGGGGRTRKHTIGGKNEATRYQGVVYDESGNISDADFETNIVHILTENKIIPVAEKNFTKELFKALPDSLEEFVAKFLKDTADGPKFQDNMDSLFSKRILGLSSYYRVADDDKDLPELVDEHTDLYHTQMCPMSDHQYTLYTQYRKKEVEKEKKSKKNAAKNKGKEEIYDVASSYRIASRIVCNFSFPTPPGRPFPSHTDDAKEVEEDELDAENVEPNPDGDAMTTIEPTYKEQIDTAIKFIKQNSADILTMDALAKYSPKFLRILENIVNDEHKGLHLVYSFFRQLEGIGIFKMALEQNGFVELKVGKDDGGDWIIKQRGEGQPSFVLYTGTESQEEKEIVRNIYNGDWADVPHKIRAELQRTASNNHFGEVVKVMLITSSAAEGINLRNTRYVHLMEPYWHLVRLQQVIGRARRFKSHIQLPPEFQNVKTFLYLTTYSEDQKANVNNNIGEGELKTADASKLTGELYTTDQSLFELADMKLKVSGQILGLIKLASIDCKIHNTKEGAKLCYDPYGQVSSNDFATKPDIGEEQVAFMEKKESKTEITKFKIKGTEYFANKVEKANETINEFNVYSDAGLRTKVGVYSKVPPKLVLDL